MLNRILVACVGIPIILVALFVLMFMKTFFPL